MIVPQVHLLLEGDAQAAAALESRAAAVGTLTTPLQTCHDHSSVP